MELLQDAKPSMYQYNYVFCPTLAGEVPWYFLIKSLNLACPKANSVRLLGLLSVLLVLLLLLPIGDSGRGEAEYPDPGVVDENDVGNFTIATLGCR